MLKKANISLCLAVTLFFAGCEENYPPEAKLEINPKSGDAPLEVKIKLTGFDENGVDDISQYILTIGSGKINSKTPIDLTRTFKTPGTINIYGEVVDSENQNDKTDPINVEVYQGPYIEQSASLSNDVEINYSATLYKVNNAELKINKDWKLFLTQNITDNSQTSPDYQKTFKYNPDGLTKGNYEFMLTSGNVDKINWVQIPNYPTTMGSINPVDFIEETDITFTLPELADINPEDINLVYTEATPLDSKTNATLFYDGETPKLKLEGNPNSLGAYQVKLKFGSPTGGLEEAVLSGNIIEDLRWTLNPFVSTNSNGAAYDLLTTKAQRDAYVQEKLFEDWTNTIPYNQDPLWDCTESSLQLMTNLNGFPNESGYSGFDLDLIYYYHRTYKDNGKYGIPLCFVYVMEGAGHDMNGSWTGNNITKFEDWNFIEPQWDSINIKPGHAYMPMNCTIEIRAPVIDNNGIQQLPMPIMGFKVENGVGSLDWINTSPSLNLIKYR